MWYTSDFPFSVLSQSLVCTRLQHSKNITSCIASWWKSNTDNKTLLLLKWSLHSIIHSKYKKHGKDISSKVCGCYMAQLTLSKKIQIVLLWQFCCIDCLHSCQLTVTTTMLLLLWRGTLKMRDMKLRDMKMRHHVAGVENARHENARTR